MKTLFLLLLLSLPCPAALQCNGTTSFMGFGKATNLNGANFTVCCWFRRTGLGTTCTGGTGGETGYPLVTKGRNEADGSNVDANYLMLVDSTINTLAGDYEDFASGANHPVKGTTFIRSNVWYHGAIVYNSNTFKVFLNGIEEGSITLTNIPRFDCIQYFGVGAAMNSLGVPTGSWAGLIEEVAVWNSAMTPLEIFRLAVARTQGMPLQMRTASLRGYWPMNDHGDGFTYTVARDWSGMNTFGFGSNAPLSRSEQVLTPSFGTIR